MNKEEKEAITYLNKYIKSDLFYEQEHYNRIEIVLNLIDKLQKELKDSINARFELQRRIDKTQKENAELKEEIKDLIEENHKHIDYIANMKKKHEDKIRTKIKELEELFDKNEKEITIQYQNQFIVDVVGVLEELLGGNE